jgi:hypothetical protein
MENESMKKHVIIVMVSIALVMMIGFGGSAYSSGKAACKSKTECAGKCQGCTGGCCAAKKATSGCTMQH